jgi:acyl-CoA-binding protein
MKRTILVCVAAVALAGSAWAQGKAPEKAPEKNPKAGGASVGASVGASAGGTGVSAGASAQMPAMDMSKMGPGARKPTNEKQTKQEVMDFFKKVEELGKKGDMEGVTAMVDFPVYMATDDLKGVPETKEYSREEYIAMMKPFYENMPKDMKVTHKPTINVLSDSLVMVIDDFSMTMGKQKVTGRNASLLVKRDGQWKWKSMIEAGYGGMGPGTGGGAQPPAEGKK